LPNISSFLKKDMLFFQAIGKDKNLDDDSIVLQIVMKQILIVLILVPIIHQMPQNRIKI